MRFKLVETGKSYAEPEKAAPTTVAVVTADDGEAPAPPIVWKGTPDEYHKLLMVREAELLLAEARLTGNKYNDWFTHNRIRDLEIKIADLRRWLAEAVEKDKGDKS